VGAAWAGVWGVTCELVGAVAGALVSAAGLAGEAVAGAGAIGFGCKEVLQSGDVKDLFTAIEYYVRAASQQTIYKYRNPTVVHSYRFLASDRRNRLYEEKSPLLGSFHHAL
jgi:hypothetical protein